MKTFDMDAPPKMLQTWSFGKWQADGNVKEGTVFNWPDLTKDSLVFDMGGYHGDWANRVWEKSHCKLVIFEPVPEHCNIIAANFAIEEMYKKDLDITVMCVAVSNQTRDDVIVPSNEASSLNLKKGEAGIPIKVVDISELMIHNGLGDKVVDLAKINIEGEEYNVIDSLYKSGLIKNFRKIILQTHPFVENPKQAYEKLYNQLAETHTRVWNYPWIWEYWTLNE